MKHVLVIGAGPAGMMAACKAAEAGAKVTLFERNQFCGIKLNITGKGRCNVTNACDEQTLMQNMTCNAKFLYSAFYAFPPKDVMAFFEGLGVPLKVERGNRVFPVSDRAKDVSGALLRHLNEIGVSIIQGRCKEILTENGSVCGLLLDDGRRFTADSVIIATGGRSYPRTGSDGDGYRMSAALGHTIRPQKPSLVPLIAADDDCGKLEGLSLKNVRLTVKKENKTIFTDFGEMVFTAKGISGPLVLSASAHLDRKNTFPYTVLLDLKPALDAETLDKRLLRDFEEQLNRDFGNALSGLLPSKMIPVIIERSGISAHEKVHNITKTQREDLGALLKAFSLTVTSMGSWHEAVVTTGGVHVKEVNPKTMESKLIPGLYFAGEVLDVDAYTGGFNLQIAWSTGYCAGTYAGKETE